MNLEISSDRRKEIKDVVFNALTHYNCYDLPVKIGSIIRSYSKIKLITYSSQIKKHNITYRELVISAETKDSYMVYKRQLNKFCIYYNDLDKNINSSNRVRWNLAHELGHVLLKHHELCNRNKLSRNDIFIDNIEDELYWIAEEEADYFSQLILVPHAALLPFNIRKHRSLQLLCKISEPASKRRFYEFNEWKSHRNAQDEYDKKIFRLYFSFTYKRKCKICEVGIIQRYGKHCIICGNKNTLEWGDGDKMKYPLLETYETGQVKECPVCENEDTETDGCYCQICGTFLTNHCVSTEQEDSYCDNTTLPSNARYCSKCGSMSSFFRDGILKAWNYNESEDKSPFMTIPDGIDERLPFYDEDLPFN